ncbi:MAG: hypothetical protein IJK89_11040, partial [Clostridia bacterium]|nr:hypothetical protein [Clostridia bacterium]
DWFASRSTVSVKRISILKIPFPADLYFKSSPSYSISQAVGFCKVFDAKYTVYLCRFPGFFYLRLVFSGGSRYTVKKR